MSEDEKVRTCFTEAEHEKLCALGDVFCQDLAKVTARILRQFKPEVRLMVLMYLQDKTSLFNPYTSDLIEERLNGK